MSLIILIIHIHFMQYRSSKIQNRDSTFIWWNHCIILVPPLNILTSLCELVTWGHENSLENILLGIKYHGLSVTYCTLYIHFFNQYCTSAFPFHNQPSILSLLFGLLRPDHLDAFKPVVGLILDPNLIFVC